MCRVLGVFTFIILTSLGAFVRIPLPFTPVPITLQTLFVLLSGVCLGSSLGGVAQISYIFLGILGFPTFTGTGSGLPYFLGPTGGYLFGFVLSSFFVGNFIRYAKNNLFLNFVIICIGDLILLFCGVIWLKFILGYSFIRLLVIGLIPFIPGDILKASVVTFIYSKLKSRLEEVF